MSHDIVRTTFERYPISEQIVLTGQPQPEAWAHLAAQGVRFVINLRSDPERAALQAANAAQHGITSVHLQLPAYELDAEHVALFEQALAQAGERTVLVQCRTASRSGLLWGLKRMIVDGWDRVSAETELVNAGYDAESMDVFDFCFDDYFERAAEPAA